MTHTSAARRPAHSTVGAGFAKQLFAKPAERRLKATLDAGLERVEQVLKEEVRFADEVAQVTAPYVLNAGGKRLRPMLLLLTAQLGPEPATPEIDRAAAAIEITHLASLYHDDVMDEATLRRGVTAAHLRWSNSTAILAGDLLFARSSQIFSTLGTEAVQLQAEVFERLVLGQMRETIGPREGEDRIAHYLQVLADKTGSLISAAARLGVMLSGAPREYEAAMHSFGESVGIAFQLVDDVIDLSPESDKTGKLAGTDLRAGVETLPVLLLEKYSEAGDAAATDLLHRIRPRVGQRRPDALALRRRRIRPRRGGCDRRRTAQSRRHRRNHRGRTRICAPRGRRTRPAARRCGARGAARIRPAPGRTRLLGCRPGRPGMRPT